MLKNFLCKGANYQRFLAIGLYIELYSNHINLTLQTIEKFLQSANNHPMWKKYFYAFCLQYRLNENEQENLLKTLLFYGKAGDKNAIEKSISNFSKLQQERRDILGDTRENLRQMARKRQGKRGGGKEDGFNREDR